MKISSQTPAKINLGLSIIKKIGAKPPVGKNGFHLVKTIYCQISLFDELCFETLNTKQIIIESDLPSIPTNDNNLIFQAAKALEKQRPVSKGIKIVVKKNIPIGSGLGGGSSNAATTLKVLNKLWQLKLTTNQLINIAKTIGADVAYHLIGGIQLEVQGGKKAGQFIKLKKLPPCFLVLCYPDIEIKSQEAYEQVQYNQINKNNLSLLIKAINAENLKNVATNLYNDFENWTLDKYTVLKQVKTQMINHGALGSLMSGKGSSIFGIFDNYYQSKKTFNLLKRIYKHTFIVKPY